MKFEKSGSKIYPHRGTNTYGVAIDAGTFEDYPGRGDKCGVCFRKRASRPKPPLAVGPASTSNNSSDSIIRWCAHSCVVRIKIKLRFRDAEKEYSVLGIVAAIVF